MSTLFDTEARLDRREHPDTEFTLSTASLLGIFFGLVLVCGVFFGFGYSMGRRSIDRPSDAKSENKAATAYAPRKGTNPTVTAIQSQPSASQQSPSRELISESDAASSPSAAGSPPAEEPAVSVAPRPAAEVRPMQQPVKTTSLVPTPHSEITNKPSAAKAAPARSAANDPASRASTSMTPNLSVPQVPMTGTSTPVQPTVVQIAAVSHSEDAEVLIAALKKRGYNVGIRREPQDQLMHVQVGPFNNKAEAVAMKQRLLADGYNAIVKP